MIGPLQVPPGAERIVLQVDLCSFEHTFTYADGATTKNITVTVTLPRLVKVD